MLVFALLEAEATAKANSKAATEAKATGHTRHEYPRPKLSVPKALDIEKYSYYWYWRGYWRGNSY